jgi:two-component system, sensor histidine kinase PdtaS
MKNTCTVLLLLCSFQLLSAQNSSKTDSLKLELKRSDNKAAVLNKLAKIAMDYSPVDALGYATQAAEIAFKKDDKKELAEAMWIEAWYYLYTNNFVKCEIFADSAKTLYHEVNDPRNEINCISIKASAALIQADYKKAQELYALVADEAKKIGARDVYFGALVNMVGIFREWGEFDKALNQSGELLILAKELNKKEYEASAYNLLGMVFLDQKNFSLSIDNFLVAYQIYKELNLQTQIPYVLVHLGIAYKDNHNYKEASRYAKLSIKHYIDLNDQWGLEQAYRVLGEVYLEMDKPDSAWICNEQSLTLCKEINEKSDLTKSLKFKGEILIRQKKYADALIYLNQAKELNAEVQSKPELINILLNIGKCYVETGSVQKGLDILIDGLRLADSLNLKEAEMNSHKEIAQAYKKLGMFKEAFQHHLVYTSLSDSIFREESNRHFVEMEQRFQSEQRQKEISQLKLDKVEQEATIRSQRWLWMGLLLGFIFTLTIGILIYRGYLTRKKADSEKEALLKEIHHRVKNNLQIISSLLSIQTENITDERVVSAVLESQGRVKAMALIHQLLYQEKELTRISFRTYLPQLVNTVSSIFKKDDDKVETAVEVADIAFDIDISIPLGLIVTELASNAFKYAFGREKEGRLKVNLESAGNGKYILTVADNGSGLPPGTRIDELNSMGLRLVKMLTGQLDGELYYQWNNGALFTIIFTETV